MSTGKKIRKVDTRKFIKLVEKRSYLYNYKMKQYYEKPLVHRTWQEIAEEMGTTVHICRAKWHSIRNGYARFTKQVAQGHQRMWHLAEDLCFLNDVVGRNNDRIRHNNGYQEGTLLLSNGWGKPLPQNPNTYEATMDEESLLEETSTRTDEETGSDSVEIVSNSDRSKSPIHIEKSPSWANAFTPQVETTCQILQRPIESCEANRNTPPPKPITTERQESTQTLDFFRSLIPDIDKLTDRRKRNFKLNVLHKLNEYLDEQEDEIQNQRQQQQQQKDSVSTQSHHPNGYCTSAADSGVLVSDIKIETEAMQ